MGKHKIKIIAALVVLVALTGAWFMGNTHINVPGGGTLVEPPPAPGQGEAMTTATFDDAALDMELDEGAFAVALTVRVDSILANMHLLNREMHELIPDDAVIFPLSTVIAYEGESVFDVLQREMRGAGIHMSARFTPAFNSAYIEAINNLYEFEVGPMSGWVYRVNGEIPDTSASLYILNPGDVIEWLYTLDLGRDVGADWLDE